MQKHNAKQNPLPSGMGSINYVDIAVISFGVGLGAVMIIVAFTKKSDKGTKK